MKTTNETRILIVEDDSFLALVLKEALSDWDVSCVQTMEQALREWKQADLILLDVVLPDGDGTELASWIREDSQVPILMLSGRGSELSQLEGYEAGADDYIVKPVSVSLLRAKVRSLLKRSQKENRRITWKACTVDPETRILETESETLFLTATEAQILAVLLSARGATVSACRIRTVLTRNLTELSLSSRISELRRKLRNTEIGIDGRADRGYRIRLS